MPKLGIRGTATGRFALRDVRVPKENILGPLGKGLRVALTVLDFGRTTFGACCTGAVKTCLQLAVKHANTRRQFNKTLGEFDLVIKKIARIAADAYAMDAMTTITASLIDRGLEDYMIETAMLKVYTTEMLWEARGPGMEFKEIYDTMLKPLGGRIGKAWTAGMNRLGAAIRIPDVPVQSGELRSFGNQLGRMIWRFNLAVNRALIAYREPILDMQLVQERIAGAAMDLFASSCVLSRWDAEMLASRRNGSAPSEHSAAELFLRQSFRRVRRLLAGLNGNEDKTVLGTADFVLRGGDNKND